MACWSQNALQMNARRVLVTSCFVSWIACVSDGAKLVQLGSFHEAASARARGLTPPAELQDLGFLSGKSRATIEAQLGPSEACTYFQEAPRFFEGKKQQWLDTTCARYRFHEVGGRGYELLVRYVEDGTCAVAHWSPIM